VNTPWYRGVAVAVEVEVAVGVEVAVAAHLQQTLQGLQHLLLAQRGQPAGERHFSAFQLPHGSLQRHGRTLQDAHA